MKSLLRGTVFFVALLALARGDDGIQWGNPVNGLRLGVSGPAGDITAGQNPVFAVTAQNVSTHPIAIPAPDSFVLKANPDSSDYHELPLMPLIRDTQPETATGLGYPSPTYSIRNGNAVELSPPRVQTLAAGQSMAWNAVPLDMASYAGDRLPPGDSRSIQHWYLLPGRQYDIQFQFANEQAQVARTKVWTGKAVTGSVHLSAKAPSADGFKLAGQFTVPKDRYFVGEPIVVTFTVTNHGDSAIEYPYGGDYRSTGRPDRFTITATDANGKAVPDPVKPGGMGGGLGSSILLKPGESHSDQLMANHWRAFTAAGVYTITCSRTLNVSRADQPRDDYYSLPEISFPAIRIESTLKVTIVDDPAALQKYLGQITLFLERDRAANEALLCLALARNETAFPVITGLLDGPPEVQTCAVPWICLYPPEKAAPVLAAHFSHLTVQAREAALAALRSFPAAQAEPMILASLRAPDAQERAAAVEACWTSVSPGSLSALLAMKGDPDPRVRRYLACALGQSGDKRAILVLVQFLDDPDLETRIWAAGELGHFQNKQGVPVLIDLLRHRQMTDQQGNIIEDLQQLTAKNLGYDPKRWLDWWKTSGAAEYGER